MVFKGKFIIKALILAAILVGSPAQGIIYMWKDSAGIAHYTNKEYEIPARYKTKTKSLYSEAADPRAMPLNTSNEQKAPDVPQAPIADQQAKTADPQKEQAAVPAQQQKNIVQEKSVKRSKRLRGNVAEE